MGKIDPSSVISPAGFFSYSIRGRLFLLLIIVLVPVILIQLLIYRDTLNTRRYSELHSNLEIARSTAAAFEDFIGNILSQEKAIVSALSSTHDIKSDSVISLLEGFERSYPNIRHIMIIDLTGRIVSSSSSDLIGIDVVDRSYFNEIIKGKDWTISELLHSEADGRAIFVVSLPIRDDLGTLTGILAVSVDGERLLNILSFIRFGGDLAILDNTGRAVYRHPQIIKDWNDRDYKKFDPQVRDALSGKEVSDISFDTFDKKMRIFAMAPIPSIGWVSRASIPEADAMATVYEQIYRNAFLFFLVVSGSFLAAMLFSRRISEPIMKLRIHAQSLQQGEYSHPIDVDGPLEVQTFAVTFNRMAEKIRFREESLRRAHDELEVLVEKRTIELARANQALGKYAARLETLNRNLEDFMFIAAHDLQEPLRKIQVFSDLFRSTYSDSLDETGRDYLRRLGSSAERVQELIRDIRAYSKLKSDTASFNKVDLKVLAQEAASDLGEMIKETGAKIQIGDLPSVLADPHQMRLLFQNLLSNAMIYRKETKPIIMISSKKLEKDLQILVEDNGIGFDEKYADLIFKPFQRLHKRKEVTGTGMGLAFCRKIVELHGGTITAKSTPGRGATFIIDLPGKQDRPE